MHISNSIKATFPIPSNEFLSEVGSNQRIKISRIYLDGLSHQKSPFYEDADKRGRYFSFATNHPSKLNFFLILSHILKSS